MLRKWLVATLGVTAATTAVILLSSTIGARQAPVEKGKEAPGADPVQARLDIGQVVLFSSGVGYFQREGTVEGTARVDLTFPVTDINDLIKSMVVRDLDGGHISTVSYDSNAPVERTLRSFAINLTANPSFGAVLTQARGERVEVVLANPGAGAAATLNGTVMGVEQQRQPVGTNTVEVSFLNLWCADGMRSVKLADVQRVRFLNPVLEGELRKALETLALSHDTQKKAVSIRFAGEGKRKVRVGYVVENPIWKTAYRLVMSQKAGENPYLQGWAVVENVSDEDWRDVRMALVSGRPISFQMDLYTPLFVARPVVEPELFASLRPVAYSGDLGMKRDREMAARPAEEAEKALRYRGDMDGVRAARPGAAGGMGGFGKGGKSGYARQSEEQLGRRMNLGDSVGTAATAARLGDFFQYAIDRPVTLPRQKSALLPIVGKDVQGSRVSIYNERTQAKFPLLGLKFKNTSGLHLMQGPITVFEGSNYAGDARILDLQPNEERLISYAVDLGTEVNPTPAHNSGRITHVKAIKGILHTTNKQRQGRTYTIKNRNDQERTLLVEHPVNNLFKLVETPVPAETASDVYRFQLKVPPGKTKELTVTEERVFGESISITNTNDDRIRWFLNEPISSQSVKAGLRKALDLRWAQAKTTREIQENQRQLNVITADQGRLRANLREVPAGSAAHKRYLAKLDEQETQIEQYQALIKRLQTQEDTQKRAFEDFLVNFSAE